jgi:hypothetical protein
MPTEMPDTIDAVSAYPTLTDASAKPGIIVVFAQNVNQHLPLVVKASGIEDLIHFLYGKPFNQIGIVVAITILLFNV